jgi:hypothetical protein
MASANNPLALRAFPIAGLNVVYGTGYYIGGSAAGEPTIGRRHRFPSSEFARVGAASLVSSGEVGTSTRITAEEKVRATLRQIRLTWRQCPHNIFRREARVAVMLDGADPGRLRSLIGIIRPRPGCVLVLEGGAFVGRLGAGTWMTSGATGPRHRRVAGISQLRPRRQSAPDLQRHLPQDGSPNIRRIDTTIASIVHDAAAWDSPPTSSGGC